MIGRRLSNELVKEKNIEDSREMTKNSIDFELVDLGFYNDLSYHQYPSWKRAFQSFTHNNLFFTKEVSSNQLYNSDAKDFLAAIPKGDKMRNLIKPLSYKLYWESAVFQKKAAAVKVKGKYENLAGQCQERISKNMEFMVNLQNFKFSLKKSKSVEEIAKMLVNLDFIEDLIGEHLKTAVKSSAVYGKKLKRNGKDLMTYLNSPLRGTFVNNYTRFMMKKAIKKEGFRNLLKIRNSFSVYKVKYGFLR